MLPAVDESLAEVIGRYMINAIKGATSHVDQNKRDVAIQNMDEYLKKIALYIAEEVYNEG
jgi:hypothetical protein